MSQQTNRSIVFSARDQGVLDLVKKYSDASQNLVRALSSAFAEEKRNTKDSIDGYEKQIQLIQKKKQLEAQTIASGRSTQGDDKRFDPKNNAFEVDRTKPFAFNKKDDCCKTQVELLRQVIQTIKDTSESQILNRQSLFEKSGGTPSTSSPLASTGGGRALPPSKGGNMLSDVAGNLGMGKFSSLLKGGPMAILALLTGAIAGVRSLYVNEMKREEALAGLSGTSGRSVFDLNNFEDQGYFGRGGVGRRDRSKYGFSEDEFMSRAVPTSRAFGTSKGINNNILNAMALERGTGMDSSTIMEMDRLSRVLKGSNNSTDITQSIYKAMRGTGAFGSKEIDLSRLNELAQTFTQFQEGEFQRSGNISQGNEFLNLRRRLEGTGETKFKRDDYAASTIQSLNQGMISEGSPEAQAIKMDILRRANPNMGYFELQAEQEKGIGAKGLLSGTMDLVKSTGGTIDQQAILLNQLTGGSMRKGDILSLLKGEVSVKDIDKKISGPDLDIEKRAEGATSDLRDAIESVKGEIGKWAQELLMFGRFSNAQGTEVIQGIDAIKKLLQ